MLYCYPETGVCEISSGQNHPTENQTQLDNTLIYFGDPMCSWCWGIAPEIDRLLDQLDEALSFKLIMGGLRPGGGDPWNEQMKNYLKTHWQHVIEKSGQPFSFKIFDKESFNYDTEPPCRAVKTAQAIQPDNDLRFYHKVQHRFYVDNEDPGELEYYEPICRELELDFSRFRDLFESDEMKKRTKKDFEFTQRLGVQGFPSLVLVFNQQPHYIARGYSTTDHMISRLEQIRSQAKKA